MKKKLLLLLATLSITLIFSACTRSSEKVSTTNPPATTSPTSVESTTQVSPAATETPVTTTKEAVAVTASIQVPSLSLQSYVIPDNAALNFVKDMKIGWNLGNTFDATNDGLQLAYELQLESAWCGVKTTKEMIQALKKEGFNTIRIPVSWHNHLTDANFTISKPWLDRVQEVVDYAISEDMYVILNIHHDIDAKYYYPSEEHLKTSTQYVTAIWQQLSDTFNAYNDHLIFESVNEPRLVGTDNEWWLDVNNPDCMASVECINQLNQTFVDIVRASGGNNANRYLMVPGYSAAPYNALLDEFRLPTDIDSADNKLIVSVHAYTPYNFALQSLAESGNIAEFKSNESNSTKDIDDFMEKLYSKFISQGIPVVIGEFGARDKNSNLQSRVDYATYYIAAAKVRSMSCCWWDNNAFGGDGENFGLLERATLSWKYPEIMEGLMKYAN